MSTASTHFRSQNEPHKDLNRCRLLLGTPNKDQAKKKICGPLLDSITSYYVKRPRENCQLSSGFLAPLLPFFRVFLGIYRLISGTSGLVWIEAIGVASAHVTVVVGMVV